jgi:hypothetical protein
MLMPYVQVASCWFNTLVKWRGCVQFIYAVYMVPESYLCGVGRGGLQYSSKVSHEQPVLQHSSATPLFDRVISGTPLSKVDIYVWKENSW